MSPITNLRKPLVYVVIYSLIWSGLLTLTLRQGHAARNSWPPPSSSAKETAEESVPQAATVDEVTRSRVTEAIGKLPLSFEENRGQVDAQVRYVSRGSGYTLFLTATEAVLTLRKADKVGRHETQGRDPFNPPSTIRNPQSARPASGGRPSAVVRMKPSGASPSPAIAGESEMRVRTNYFKGNDPEKWQTDVARYERVRYRQVYPGVDMIYYGEQQQLEYDFEVAPGADARRIALEFTGVKRVKVERRTGDLVLKTAGGEVRQHKPVAYQEVGGERREVESRYVMRGKGKVGIEIGEYDRTQRLIIDPTLNYSTYLGGSNGDGASGIAVDSAGNAYVTGTTNSTNFPTKNQYQTFQGDSYYRDDAFVTKLDTNLSGAASLLYSTYLGGSGVDVGEGIAADASGNVYVTGYTFSTDFPTKNQYQTYQGNYDVFVTKLDTNASGAASLLYSTYLGDSNVDEGYGIAADASGHAYVTGPTGSTNFPTLNQYQTWQGDLDVFVTKLDTNLSGAASLLYSTYLGDSRYDFGTGIAVDTSGNAYVTGYTNSPNFPTKNQYQLHRRGYGDAFVTKLDTNASGAASLLYSTYLGDTVSDRGYSIAVDTSGNAYVTGYTNSPNFPTKNQYQTYQGGVDAFVTKLDTGAAGAASLLYSTYLGGSSDDYVSGIAVDTSGHAYVTGYTISTDFPTLNQYQTDQPVNDAFVTKLDTNASGAASLLYSTYLGGNGYDQGSGIAVDASGHAYVVGTTLSTDFPKKNQYQTSQGYGDAFVTKLIDSYSISGKVTTDTANGAGLADVTVTLMGGADFTPRTVTTADDGTYSFTDVTTPGNYKIRPTLTNYTFSPTQLVSYNATADQTDKNFIATLKAYTISGVVRLGAAGLSGVTVKLSSPTPAGFTARTTTTSSTGAYSFTNVPAARNYTVTPTKVGYQFTPTNKVLTNLSANQTANFLVKVYSITGRIMRTGTTTGISAVTVTLTSPTPAGFAARTVQTNSMGVYTFTNVPAGRNYTIKPTKSGFTFTPTTRSITNLSGNIGAGAATNFTGAGP